MNYEIFNYLEGENSNRLTFTISNKDSLLKTQNVDKCRECGSLHIVQNKSDGVTYCQDCNLEHQSFMIDHGNEWRTFSNMDNCSGDHIRAGGSTKIMLKSGGLTGSMNKDQLVRNTDPNREYKKGFNEIEIMSDKLRISLRRVRDIACEIFKRMLELGLQKSTQKHVIQAASLLYSARLNGGGSNRTFKEMVLATSLSIKEVSQ
jgi:transcription initiation factor TFIIIB Brf1 subunit/transcription initiation factor TFIIB